MAMSRNVSTSCRGALQNDYWVDCVRLFSPLHVNLLLYTRHFGRMRKNIFRELSEALVKLTVCKHIKKHGLAGARPTIKKLPPECAHNENLAQYLLLLSRSSSFLTPYEQHNRFSFPPTCAEHVTVRRDEHMSLRAPWKMNEKSLKIKHEKSFEFSADNVRKNLGLERGTHKNLLWNDSRNISTRMCEREIFASPNALKAWKFHSSRSASTFWIDNANEGQENER